MATETIERYWPTPWNVAVNQVIAANGATVCIASARNGETPAVLIAAAPELYEALTELCDRIGARWFLEQNWAKPLEVLAKARGEQP